MATGKRGDAHPDEDMRVSHGNHAVHHIAAPAFNLLKVDAAVTDS